MEIALYRKYRPKNWGEVIGQDHIVKVLEHEAKTGKVSHAYLFSGSRGTGKTSLARIFAKSLNVSEEDTYEIDAASNRGIDEIRAIRDAVHTYPYSSKYKVYIVDEAHMLTKDAWNAFLKTLEEPPSHVIFILATTEEHKLLDTVVSRCECFAFKKPTHAALAAAVAKVAEREGYKLEKKSAALVATLADGSFRDALSIVQKAIHSSDDKNLSHKEIEEVLGAPSSDIVVGILEGIQKNDANEALLMIKKAREENVDMGVLLNLIIRSLRFVLLLRFGKDMKLEVVDATGEEEFVRLEALAKTAKNINSKTLLLFLEALSRQPFSSLPELPIELAVIDSVGEHTSV